MQVRTTYYGGQRTQANSEADSPDRSEKVSLRDMKMDLHVSFLFAILRKNDLTSAGKAGRSQLAWVNRPSPRMQPCCKFDRKILEGDGRGAFSFS